MYLLGGAPRALLSLPVFFMMSNQKLDGDLWQQGQGGGQLGVGTRPAGMLVAPSEEPEVQQAETGDRKVCRLHPSAQIFLKLSSAQSNA